MPVPDDFAPQFTTASGALRWSQSVQIGCGREQVVLELGFPLHGHDLAVIQQQLRADVWRLLERAKVGDVDAIRHARRDRHRGHPVSSPTL